MNCSDLRASFPDLLYGRLEPAAKTQVEQHFARCAACRAEWQALQHVRHLLDAPVAPTVQVDLSGLYRRAAEEQTRQTRRWRRMALAVCGAAAVLGIVAFGLRLDVRLEAHQLVVRWGVPPATLPPPPRPAAPEPIPHALVAYADDVRLLRELIHALAADVDARDRRQQEELTQLQGRLRELQRQANVRLADTERHLAALQAAQSLQSLKGANE
jgi:hypothetical protein